MDDFRQVTCPGQLTGDGAITLARTMAEAIRGLNHVTRHEAGLGQPSAAYDILGALSLAASRLPQLPTQLTGYLDRALAAALLLARAVNAAGIFLGDARASAAALAGDLDAAWQQLACINGRPSHDRKDPS